MFFRKKKAKNQIKEIQNLEVEIQAVRQQTIASVDKLTDVTEDVIKNTDKLIKRLEKDWDVNLALFLATRGANRGKR